MSASIVAWTVDTVLTPRLLVARCVKGSGHRVIVNDIQAIQVSKSLDRPTHFYGVHDLGANLANPIGNSVR